MYPLVLVLPVMPFTINLLPNSLPSVVSDPVNVHGARTGKITINKNSLLLAFMTFFSIGGSSWSLNDTTTSHCLTPAAAYMLVENLLGGGMKEVISKSESWEMETQKDGQPHGWHPSTVGLAEALSHPQQCYRTVLCKLEYAPDEDCEFTSLTRSQVMLVLLFCAPY